MLYYDGQSMTTRHIPLCLILSMLRPVTPFPHRLIPQPTQLYNIYNPLFSQFHFLGNLS